MPKPLIAVSMMGANKSASLEDNHPFDMSTIGRYPVKWLCPVRRKEREQSPLFYHTGMAVHACAERHGIGAGDVRLIFGRGTIMNLSERRLARAIREEDAWGGDAYKVVVAKSYGCIDTLRAFRRLEKRAAERLGTIDLMILVDPYATPIALRSVTESIDTESGKKRRLVIPPFVRAVQCVVQSTEGFEGIEAGRPGDPRVRNVAMEDLHADPPGVWYDRYKDGHRRKLSVEHRAMDELAGVVPWCEDEDGACTMEELIARAYGRAVAS